MLLNATNCITQCLKEQNVPKCNGITQYSVCNAVHPIKMFLNATVLLNILYICNAVPPIKGDTM